MSIIRQPLGPSVVRAQSVLNSVGTVLPRYGLVVVIAWIGAMKFTSYEAHGIEPLVSNSPLMSWMYGIFSITTFSSLLGVLELATAALLAVKPWFPRASAIGSVLAIGLFVATISFMFTTPGIGEASAGGFPVLSATGQFLVKDLALLGISVWTLLDALSTGRTGQQ
ncbi:YkgB family protein [Mycolicibacterium peregrinum]|uniref:YkgB family protein n=1 Tax=Mycolicibacterium peregrinum TaxID=43304 RepID=UPI003AAD4343